MTKLIGLVICLLIPGTLPAQMQGPLCHQPTLKCSSSYSFAPYQLPFVIKEKLVFGKSYQSEEFYAVVLKLSLIHI